MTCQELLALSVAFSAALPTGGNALASFYSNLIKKEKKSTENVSIPENTVLTQNGHNGTVDGGGGITDDFSCCYELYQNSMIMHKQGIDKKKRSKLCTAIIKTYRTIRNFLRNIRKFIKSITEHKYFQQGILLAILINTLSMGIEYHNQPPELTAFVETSNIVFSAIFAVEMLLKILAEGPFKYIANGFNVFDGVIVILRYVFI